MRILFVHQHLGAFGGAEANILLTAEELRKLGHQVALLYGRATGKGEEKWAEIFSQAFKLPNAGNLEHVEAVLDRFQPDLIYLHTLSDLAVIDGLQRSGIPVVRMVHDHALYCLRAYKYNPLTRAICTKAAGGHCVFPCMAVLARNRSGGLPVKWASFAEKQQEIELNRKCAQFVVYSEYSRNELVGNGFDPARIHIHVPIRCWGTNGPVSSFTDRNLILFAGQIIRGKGVDVLLRALKKVQAHFECVIIGEGSHRKHCEKLCRRLGLSDRVHFTGYLPHEEITKYYLEASVFAVSSVWPEPFGMVGPEAMRFGLPVVGFDSGAISEWLNDGENGFLVPWMDTNLFASRLKTLLCDKRLAREFGRRGMEGVNTQYDSRRQVAKLEEIFKRVLIGNFNKQNEATALNVVHGNCE